MLSEEEKNFLLRLARNTIEDFLEKKESYLDENIPERLMEKGASFVNLIREGKLQNSMGSLIATRELFQDVMQNSLSAAFEDTRFPPINKEDLDKIKIEISIPTKLRELEYSTIEELLSKIKPGTHGIIIRKQGLVGTLLPQVWFHVPDKIQFLSSICHEMGLEKDAWKSKAEIFTYEIETFREQ